MRFSRVISFLAALLQTHLFNNRIISGNSATYKLFSWLLLNKNSSSWLFFKKTTTTTTQQTCSQSKDTHSWSQTQSEENPSDTVHVVRSVGFSPLSPNCFPETLSSKRTGCCALSRCKYFYQYSNNINVGIPGCIFTIKASPLGFSYVMLVDKQLFTHLHENNNNANNAGIGETDLYQVRVANLDHIVLVFYFEKQHQFPASAASFTAQMQLELCSSAFQSQAGSPNTHKYVLW